MDKVCRDLMFGVLEKVAGHLFLGRLLFLFFIYSVALSLTSCSGSGSFTEEEGEESKFLRLNIITEPPVLHPTKLNDTTSGNVTLMLFDGLMRIAADGSLQPSVAQGYDISNDGKAYTFYLKETFWSNGDPLTAYDFEYAWKEALKPEMAAPYSYKLFYIKNAEEAFKGEVSFDEVGIEVLDELTLRVTLKHPLPFFPELMAFHTYFPINKKVAERNANWFMEAGPDYVSNGPFVMKEWKHNNRVVVERNPHYWDADVVKLEGITMSMINDNTTELNMFQNDELDIAGSPMGDIPAEAYDSLREEGLLRSHPLIGTYWYDFNTRIFPLNNKKFRKALALAVDRQALVDHILQGNQKVAFRFVPPSLLRKNEPLFQEDRELAKQLFEEALTDLGIEREELPLLKLSYNTDEGHHKIAQYIQQVWNEVLGLTIELQNMEWKVFLSTKLQGDFHIARMGWLADYRDPTVFLEIFKNAQVDHNYNKWENKAYEELLIRAEVELDEEKRRKLLDEAERILIDEMAVMPLYNYEGIYVINERVKDVYFGDLSSADFKWASIRY